MCKYNYNEPGWLGWMWEYLWLGRRRGEMFLCLSAAADDASLVNLLDRSAARSVWLSQMCSNRLVIRLAPRVTWFSRNALDSCATLPLKDVVHSKTFSTWRSCASTRSGNFFEQPDGRRIPALTPAPQVDLAGMVDLNHLASEIQAGGVQRVVKLERSYRL